MRLTFRAKLLLIVGATACAFALVILTGSLSGVRESERLEVLERRLLPLLELGPQLEVDFEHLRQTLRDAAAAQDPETLAETRGQLGTLSRRVTAARDILDAKEADKLLAALEGYYWVAYDVSRRMVAGETGEALVTAMTAMQNKQGEVETALQRAVALDRRELTASFATARQARQSAARSRLYIGIACMLAIVALSMLTSRGILRAIGRISEGFARFGRGQFSQAIEIESDDEIGYLGREANQMAANLDRLNREREQIDWQKTGLAGLAHELRGELGPVEVADRALRFVAGYVGAPAGALYFEKDGPLTLLGRCALGGAELPGAPANVIQRGEGLVGAAAQRLDIVDVNEVPSTHLRIRSALGESIPRSLVLVPLPHLGKVKGVLELALFAPLAPRARDLLATMRETIVIALEVASGRAAMADLLAETQRQAVRLGSQEQELRANNEELQAQQEELRQFNEELDLQRRTLEQQNAALEDARRTLQEKATELLTVSAYKSRFLANMSHELRTPLNSMLILSDLLSRNEAKNLSDKQVEFCRTINGAGRDLLALINQVLDLAKIEAGKQQLHVDRVALSEVVQHLHAIFDPLASDKGLAFSVIVDDSAPETIRTDRQRIDQVLTNLCGNAIKFTAKGEVVVHMGKADKNFRFRRADLVPEQSLVISVRDTGIGIAPEHQELVFTPFERLEQSTGARYAGTGLGLSIARELVSLLGGELHLESVPGQGSTFTVCLPFETPTASPAKTPAHPGGVSFVPPTTVIPPTGAGRSQLLIIEDDPVVAELLTNIIKDRGFDVLHARSGNEGVGLARKHQPSGVILDVSLPDIDGWTVMEHLRRDPETQAIPVHFLSAVDAAERGWAMGAIGYLTKPASHRQLVSMVQSLAPRASQLSQKVLLVEDDADAGDSLVQFLGGEGLEPLRVPSGRDAFVALEQERFACIVLDLGLPDMNGLSFLEALRAREDIERPPVIVYTARALTKEETRRIEAYAEAVVLKEGRSAERLLEEIRLFIHHLRRRHPQTDEGRRVGGPNAPVDPIFRGKILLVVDDDMRTVYALSALLRSKGIEVLMADTGRAAIDTLDGAPNVDAVIMDVMMPEMDGYEAMRRIRQQARFAELPVIALTAKAMKGERERCLEAGANDYLSKPIDSDELLSVLGSWLTDPHGARRGA